MDVSRLCRDYIVDFKESNSTLLYIKGEEERLISISYNPEEKEVVMSHVGDEPTEKCDYCGYCLRATPKLLNTLKKVVRNSLPNFLQKEEDFEHIKDSLYEKDYFLFEKKGNFYFPTSIVEARKRGQLEYNDNIYYYVDFEGDIIIDERWIAMFHGATGCEFTVNGKDFAFSVEDLAKIANSGDEDDEDDEGQS